MRPLRSRKTDDNKDNSSNGSTVDVTKNDHKTSSGGKTTRKSLFFRRNHSRSRRLGGLFSNSSKKPLTVTTTNNDDVNNATENGSKNNNSNATANENGNTNNAVASVDSGPSAVSSSASSSAASAASQKYNKPEISTSTSIISPPRVSSFSATNNAISNRLRASNVLALRRKRGSHSSKSTKGSSTHRRHRLSTNPSDEMDEAAAKTRNISVDATIDINNDEDDEDEMVFVPSTPLDQPFLVDDDEEEEVNLRYANHFQHHPLDGLEGMDIMSNPLSCKTELKSNTLTSKAAAANVNTTNASTNGDEALPPSSTMSPVFAGLAEGSHATPHQDKSTIEGSRKQDGNRSKARTDYDDDDDDDMKTPKDRQEERRRRRRRRRHSTGSRAHRNRNNPNYNSGHEADYECTLNEDNYDDDTDAFGRPMSLTSIHVDKRNDFDGSTLGNSDNTTVSEVTFHHDQTLSFATIFGCGKHPDVADAVTAEDLAYAMTTSRPRKSRTSSKHSMAASTTASSTYVGLDDPAGLCHHLFGANGSFDGTEVTSARPATPYRRRRHRGDETADSWTDASPTMAMRLGQGMAGMFGICR